MDRFKTDRREHILDVAQKVFSEHGFDGASTRMISGAAGVNIAMLNYYFGSKEGLFLAIFERRISLLPPLINNVVFSGHLTSWEKLAALIDNLVERIMVNDSFQELISRELAMQKRWDVTDKIVELVMKDIYEIKVIIDDGVKSGAFNRDADIGMIAATIIGTKNYIMNYPQLSSLIIGSDMKNKNFLEDKFKPRVKSFIKSLLTK